MTRIGSIEREPWVHDEARLPRVARQVIVRALRRPLRVIAIALGVTVFYVGLRGVQAPRYLATMYFHMVEGDFTDKHNAPRRLADIRQYILNVGLSRSRVEQLMRKYDVSAAFLERDRVAAIDEFREEIEIEVSRNYFIYDRRPDDPPRSADVTLSLRGDEPGRTRAILKDIAAAILDEQVARRKIRLAQARELLAAQLTLAKGRAKSVQDDLDRRSLDLAKADPGSAIGIHAQIASLQATAKGAINQVVTLERDVAELAFSAAAEGKQLGLTFELFDESLATFAPRLSQFQLLRLAAIIFAIALVLTVPLVGAFDDRIFAPEDLQARGLPLFGALHRFPGDDAGSYRARVQNKV